MARRILLAQGTAFGRALLARWWRHSCTHPNPVVATATEAAIAEKRATAGLHGKVATAIAQVPIYGAITVELPQCARVLDHRVEGPALPSVADDRRWWLNL